MGKRNSKSPEGSAIALIRFAARLKANRLVPALWLMTSDAAEDRIAAAMIRLPPGSGVIFRHYDTPGRAGIAARLRQIARARRLAFLVAGDPKLAVRVRADGFHAPEWAAAKIPGVRRAMPHAMITMAVHGQRGLITARAIGAGAVLVSPVFATASHPGAPVLGPVRLSQLAMKSTLPVIALGGIDGHTARRLSGVALHGVAAISGLMD